MFDDDYEKFVYNKLFQINASDDNIIWKIANWNEKVLDEDIVVIPGCGTRAFSYSEFGSIVFDKWITDKMNEYSSKTVLYSKNTM